MKTLVAALFAMTLLAACVATRNDPVDPLAPLKVPEAGPEPSPVLHPGSSIDVLSWNIHKQADAKPWKLDMSNPRCVGTPDIILLQEAVVSDRNGLADVLTAKGMRGEFISNFRDIVKGPAGVVTAAQASPLKAQGHLSSAREPILSTPKPAVFTTYKVQVNGSHRKLLVANVHGINFHLIGYERHMEEIFKVIAEYQADHAIILAGDFNTWSKGRRAILDRSAEAAELSRVEIDDATPPKPWLQRLLPFVHDTPLDHIFYSKKALRPISQGQALSCTIGSDHKPLRIAFSFLENPPATSVGEGPEDQ